MINESSRGRAKVFGIPRGGDNAKKWKIPKGNFKNFATAMWRGVNIFFSGKAQCLKEF